MLVIDYLFTNAKMISHSFYFFSTSSTNHNNPSYLSSNFFNSCNTNAQAKLSATDLASFSFVKSIINFVPSFIITPHFFFIGQLFISFVSIFGGTFSFFVYRAKVRILEELTPKAITIFHFLNYCS